jgi:hypothetical protein
MSLKYAARYGEVIRQAKDRLTAEMINCCWSEFRSKEAVQEPSGQQDKARFAPCAQVNRGWLGYPRRKL